VLESLGLKVITVPEQREGNGDFPTVEKPNPEEAPAMKMAVDLGKKEHADVVMATDPDADRFGTAVPNDKTYKDYTLITGNQMGALFADYNFLSLKELGKLPKNAAMVNSIVTTGMQAKVASLYGADCVECLTGFKWIANVMREAEEGAIDKTIVYGTEESYGYLVENEVRDKDGVSAAALCAEMTLYWRSQGKSLLDRLNELYEKVGYWQEMGMEKYFPGPEGPAKMRSIMDGFRTNPPKALGGAAVEKVRDVEKSVTTFLDTGKTEKVTLPKSDVLQFYLKDGTVVSARPSGTEPKIKFYATSCTPLASPGADALEAAKKTATDKLNAIKAELSKAME
jgi:phosphoglucomutase